MGTVIESIDYLPAFMTLGLLDGINHSNWLAQL